MVAEARDLRAGRDPEPRLDHAAEHHAEPERPRGVRHPHRLADPARLRELDRDPVRPLGAGGDVGERVAVLVDVDRDRRAAPQLGPVRDRRAGSGCSQYSSGICGSSSSASSSDQYSFTSTWSGSVGRRANGAHALEVEPVAPAELQLQPPEPARRGLLGAARHVVGIAEPDRPRGRRALPRRSPSSR